MKLSVFVDDVLRVCDLKTLQKIWFTKRRTMNIVDNKNGKRLNAPPIMQTIFDEKKMRNDM